MRFDLFCHSEARFAREESGLSRTAAQTRSANTQIPLSLRSFGMTKENTNFFIDT